MEKVATKGRLSAQEFLVWDAQQTIRHEFMRGELIQREGSDERHVTLVGNLAVALRGHLRGTAYRTLTSDMKLHVAKADAYLYPDLMVTCSTTDANPLIKTAPVLVVEVLSPSTAAYDRGDKFAAYRTLELLREYLLVDIASRRSDLYRKGADGLWVLHPFSGSQAVQLASVDMTLSAESLWAEVDPPGAAPTGQ